MILLFLFSFFFYSLASECGVSNPVEDQMAHGISPLGKWPWQVYVTTPDSICGGTIIADRWVLTAAHCFGSQLKGETFEEKPSIRAGAVNVGEDPKDEAERNNMYDVLTFYTHEEYDNETYANDIALLELERPISYSSTISPICLANADQDVNIDQEAWIVGFGAYLDDHTGVLVPYASTVLRETSIPLSLHTKCKSEWEEGHEVDPLICAGSHGIGAGQGDSGGPLMVQSVDGQWYQVGVVSFGEEDADIATNHTIGAYTSVGHYCDWIESTSRGEATCAGETVEMKLLPEEDREQANIDTYIDEEDKKDEEGKEEESSDEDEYKSDEETTKISLSELLSRHT